MPQFITAGTKILSMVVENLHFLNSLNYLPMTLKGIRKSFDLTWKEGVLSPLLLHGQKFELCGTLSRTQVLCGRLYVRWWVSPIFGLVWGLKDKRWSRGKNCWPTVWTTSMYWGRRAVLFRICFCIWSRWTHLGKPLQYRPFAIRCSGPCFWNLIL